MEGGMSLDDLDKPTPSVDLIAKKHKVPVKKILNQLEKGIQAEYEHTSNFKTAKEIALDHLNELPDYYDRLEKMEESVFVLSTSRMLELETQGLIEQKQFLELNKSSHGRVYLSVYFESLDIDVKIKNS
jgi:hypothetical protein